MTGTMAAGRVAGAPTASPPSTECGAAPRPFAAPRTIQSIPPVTPVRPPRAPRSDGGLDHLRAVAGAVADPEIPVLTLDDLGIVRDVRWGEGDLASTVLVELTPTYTGCPATEVIAADVAAALRAAGAGEVVVRTVLSPAWTTDWISDEGRRKLREYGIAPPGACRPAGSGPARVALTLSVRCPRCGSGRTREVSRFGATPCQSHWTCLTCLEPFDTFKAI